MRSPLRRVGAFPFRGTPSPRRPPLLEASLSTGDAHRAVAAVLRAAHTGDASLARVLRCGPSADRAMCACAALPTPPPLWPPFLSRLRPSRDASLCAPAWRAVCRGVCRAIRTWRPRRSPLAEMCAATVAETPQQSAAHAAAAEALGAARADAFAAFGARCFAGDAAERAVWLTAWRVSRASRCGASGAYCGALELTCAERPAEAADLAAALFAEGGVSRFAPRASSSAVLFVAVLDALSRAVRAAGASGRASALRDMSVVFGVGDVRGLAARASDVLGAVCRAVDAALSGRGTPEADAAAKCGVRVARRILSHVSGGRADLPHADLARLVAALLAGGFVCEAGDVGGRLARADFVDLRFYSLQLLGAVYHAARAAEQPRSTTDAIADLYRHRRRVFGEDDHNAPFAITNSAENAALVLRQEAPEMQLLRAKSTIAVGGAFVVDVSFGVWLRKATAIATY